jgi:hypothetical protein
MCRRKALANQRRIMRIGPIAWLALLVGLAAVACAGDPVSSNDNGAPTDETPHIGILSPEADAVLSDRIEIAIEVSGFIMDGDAIGGPIVPGRGHWHVYLNGQLVVIDVGTEAVLQAVPPGVHDITLELVNNDHSPLSPRVLDSVIVVVE